MKRNLVEKILGKFKFFVQDFVPIRTALNSNISFFGSTFTVHFGMLNIENDTKKIIAVDICGVFDSARAI